MTAPCLHIDYLDPGAREAVLARSDTLAVLGFGLPAPAPGDDPRWLHLPLACHGEARLEVWRGSEGVRHGHDGDIRWACDGTLLFGAIEVTEQDGDIEAAARYAYARLSAHVAAQGYPHFLRICNYFDAITRGEGDAERYRAFCVGRYQGWGPRPPESLPAATAIGRLDGRPVLQVYWLATRTPGTPLENPRQVSAYHYPRQYGRQPPGFARAMLPPPSLRAPLLLSGTAAVVGHASQHADDLPRQLEEIFTNFDALLAAARAQRPGLPGQFGPHTRLKVYVRDAGDLPLAKTLLDARLGSEVPYLLLHAAVCRRELAIEIDGIHA